MKVDLNMVRAYLDALDPNSVFTFQTFDDSASKNGGLAKVLHGTLAEHGAELSRLNDCGAGVFVMVNRGDGIVREDAKTCRTKDNVIAVRALFVDLDGEPPEAVMEAARKPNIMVESSPGRYHGYWLAPACPLGEFTIRQKQLAAKFNGDPVVHDLARVMRIPGFIHRKDAPFQTKTIWIKL